MYDVLQSAPSVLPANAIRYSFSATGRRVYRDTAGHFVSPAIGDALLKGDRLPPCDFGLDGMGVSDISVDWLSGDIAPDPWIYTPIFSATLDAASDDVCVALFDSMLSNSI